MIHIYCGDGKGKTTASIGLAVRAAGAGKRVYIARFLKSSASGEIHSLALIPNITVGPCPEKMKFTYVMSEQDKADYRDFASKLLSEAFSSGAQLLILDECCGAVSAGLIDIGQLLDCLNSCPENTEIVFTGRDPHPELVKMADYITQMQKVRHPFDSGQTAREGIEY